MSSSDFDLAHMSKVANERLSLDLEWYGQQEFADEPLGSWRIGDDVMGALRSSGPLTYVTITGAGHMVSSKDDYLVHS